MSGLEVFGAVAAALGLYPVLLQACETYKVAKSSGSGFDKLIRRLKTERVVFENFLVTLLRPDVEERELARLLDNPGESSCWRDPALYARLKDRHGYKTIEHILSIIKELNDLLQAIEKSLPGVALSFEKQHSKLRLVLRNIRVNLPDSTTQTQLAELKEYNLNLRRLVENQVIPSASGPFRHPIPSFEIPQYDTSDARYIYAAIENGYRCECRWPHLASLEMPNITSTLTSRRPQPTTQRTLQLLFKSLNFQSEASDIPYSAVEFAEPKQRENCAVLICECNDDENETIPDLCSFVKSFSESIPDISTHGKGRLQTKEKNYRLNAALLRESIAEAHDVVSLEDLTSKLERSDRMGLAVRLTYAIIQYHSTGWIDSCWTWKDFSVTRSGGITSDTSQLFISQKFYSNSDSISARNKMWSGWLAVGEPVLTRLGFALIELALGKRLCELRDSTIDPNSDEDAQAYWTACRALDTGKVRRAESIAYELVVKACLRHDFEDSQYNLRRLDSREKTFEKDVEQCVLKPLHCMWKEQWGGNQRQMCV